MVDRHVMFRISADSDSMIPFTRIATRQCGRKISLPKIFVLFTSVRYVEVGSLSYVLAELRNDAHVPADDLHWMCLCVGVC